MRLFGSMTNRMGEMVNVEPKVGMGATINMHSDRHAATIIEILSPTRIRVQEDKAELVKGSRMSESQEYEFFPNPKGSISTFSKRKNGLWIKQGHERQLGTSLTIGERDEYYDPSF